MQVRIYKVSDWDKLNQTHTLIWSGYWDGKFKPTVPPLDDEQMGNIVWRLQANDPSSFIDDDVLFIAWRDEIAPKPVGESRYNPDLDAVFGG